MFTKSKNYNTNYLAQIVEIHNFTPHPNADKMKLAHVGGYTICVGVDEDAGKYIYFPTNCTINPNILRSRCLYRNTEKNANSENKGFFNDNGRVTAIKLRGIASEGFLLPVQAFIEFVKSELNINLNYSDFITGTEFDTFECQGKSFWVNKKYIVQRQDSNSTNTTVKRNKYLKGFDKIDESQFSFHYDTVQVKKQPWCVTPNDIISITSKWHGTSHISAYVICNIKMTPFKRLANLLLGNGWKTPHRNYDYIYSSRSVIKNRYINKEVKPGYYNVDLWKYADDILKSYIIKGMTIYAEIVGFTPDGKYIQKGYDYGCIPPMKGEVYTYNKHFKIRVYRITLTNIDGVKHEFSAREVQQWCFNNGLEPVKEFYYGYAKDLYKDLDPEDPEWNSKFWDKMSNDENFFMEKNSPDCVNEVPHEGVVIKVEDMFPRAWKLKTFAFLNGEQKELDAGQNNIEDEN